MSQLSSIISVFLLALLTSCSNGNNKDIRPVNDTTQIINFSIRAAFDSGRLPDASSVKDKYYFRDSILFTADSLPLKYLPTSVDLLNFKVLSRDHLCKIIIADSLSNKQPNYLSITTFKKIDSVYLVEVSSLSCLPYTGGGMVSFEISKSGDSLIILRRGSLSIN